MYSRWPKKALALAEQAQIHAASPIEEEMSIRHSPVSDLVWSCMVDVFCLSGLSDAPFGRKIESGQTLQSFREIGPAGIPSGAKHRREAVGRPHRGGSGKRCVGPPSETSRGKTGSIREVLDIRSLEYIHNIYIPRSPNLLKFQLTIRKRTFLDVKKDFQLSAIILVRGHSVILGSFPNEFSNEFSNDFPNASFKMNQKAPCLALQEITESHSIEHKVTTCMPLH